MSYIKEMIGEHGGKKYKIVREYDSKGFKIRDILKEEIPPELTITDLMIEINNLKQEIEKLKKNRV